MATLSVREVASDCLGRSGALSLKKHIFGVYGSDNPQDRSLLKQLDLIMNRPFVRVALVTIRPVSSASGPCVTLQRDLDNANEVYQRECGSWVYCAGSRVERTSILGPGGILNQDDCRIGIIFGIGHSVSDEEDALFNLGRDMGADIVCYYINGAAGTSRQGCAAHPEGRRGFWVIENAGQWIFAHELGHLHTGGGHSSDSANLMNKSPSGARPRLTAVQCGGHDGVPSPGAPIGVLVDRDMERCS